VSATMTKLYFPWLLGCRDTNKIVSISFWVTQRSHIVQLLSVLGILSQTLLSNICIVLGISVGVLLLPGAFLSIKLALYTCIILGFSVGDYDKVILSLAPWVLWHK
jgi:hypothetical protein